jgi:predicted MFS family arabinose efflux permease
VRQWGVPQEFQGRVTGVYLVALFLGVIVGQALGGPIAQRWGLTAPFWFAFAGSAITLAPVRRQLPHIAHSDATAGR